MPARNLVILCTDQMRGDCLGINGLDADAYTPHMDALCGRGVLLSRHFSTFPKCTPARVSLVTGRYAHTDGYRDITQLLPADRPDLLSTLIDAGYQTALFGKNHCWEHALEASQTPPDLEPGKRGQRLDHHSWKPPFAEIYRRHAEAAAEPEPDPHGVMPPDARSRCDFAGRGSYPTDEAFAEQAVSFVTEHRDRDRPFFLQLNLERPHTPYKVEEPWFSRVDREALRAWPRGLPAGAPLPMTAQREHRTGADVEENEAALREIQAVYLGMIAKVDHLMGQVVGAIEAQGLFDDTVVLLWSDHGDYAGQHGLVEKWDTSFCDCLTHVPAAIVAPSLPAGRRLEALTDHTDLAPTLLDLLDLPPLPGAHGRSLLPVIEGERAGREAVFADGGHDPASRAAMAARGDVDPDQRKQLTYQRVPDSLARAQMVRTHRHKLVVREAGGDELYDLAADPWEMDNRIDDPALAAARCDLLQRLARWNLDTLPDRPPLARVGA
ncbi:sulfatase-like hydrolase/transferase [Phycisphaera mikurensis]|uniref:Putative sulfatase n=1 Tax=Phycisphaera mikurensis (strain NBRC 102666 / KCTC 22515 / FYK2301M01) TaxID=1142394 RepID=I0ICY4_PHYMF|nr:sulfatase-like hydrolase/transferase [Phycisphaera mikurensis]MBB6442252.1 choline-sulfatase [Phycisphaera mikurensis]BAM03122.1 putative sulfatase [Phycisphaera mikurensis NBRC 102666]